MPSLLSSFLDLIFPPKCPFCDVISRELICPKCLDAVKFITSPICDVCGIPFKSEYVESHTCGECMKKRRHFSWARSVLVYNDATARAIHRFKYNKDTVFSKPFGSMICEHLDISNFDIIIPVPLHVKRLRERGFNQSLLLAKVVGRKNGVPVDPFALKRSRWTEPQVNLSGNDRKINVKEAFAVRGDVKDKRVLLIDDVYTTGATVGECSKVLKKSGAKDVCVITLARTAEL